METTGWDALTVLAGAMIFFGGAAGFLLLGWRMGRESAGLPMFSFGPGDASGAETDAAAEGDPWAEASAESESFP